VALLLSRSSPWRTSWTRYTTTCKPRRVSQRGLATEEWPCSSTAKSSASARSCAPALLAQYRKATTATTARPHHVPPSRRSRPDETSGNFNTKRQQSDHHSYMANKHSFLSSTFILSVGPAFARLLSAPSNTIFRWLHSDDRLITKTRRRIERLSASRARIFTQGRTNDVAHTVCEPHDDLMWRNDRLLSTATWRLLKCCQHCN